jgi:hypothetical protein
MLTNGDVGHLKTNPQLELAYEYVCHTNRNVFLTGKAGTGKTTFLHRVKREAIKRLAVVAPTGVAAINAGGMTIHSFFQLPFGPYLPGNAREAARQRRFSGEKIRLIKSLDLLVIDEISMVRADLLDGVDEVLRRYKNPFLPFGGIQLLMIGDLHQLPPVVKEEEWYLLRDRYPTPYFFSSQALRKTRPVVVELKHIYRQSDHAFIELLNKVRGNEIDAETLQTLNSRFTPHFEPRDEEGYITLTTHNASAQMINAQKLAAIDEPTRVFTAAVKGDFPAHAYPTDETLELKRGAQVMFVKNDPSPEKRFYNGKIGKIARFEKDAILVRCPDEAEDISVAPLEWKNVKYTIDERTKEVTEEEIGAFIQYPLKLAWAITIHKSQGLTFERVILDAQQAFAHGQVYVALSRCKSFEGIVLCSKIIPSSVRTDSTVKQFTEEAEKNAPDETFLEKEKIAYQQTLLLELFGLETIRKALDALGRVLLEHEQKFHAGAIQAFHVLAVKAQNDIFPVADKFCRQLKSLFANDVAPLDDETLRERVHRARAWFVEKLDGELNPTLDDLRIIADNQTVRKSALEALKELKRALFVRNACFAAIEGGFSPPAYLRAKAAAELRFAEAQRSVAPPLEDLEEARYIENPELYARLRKWRAALAADEDVAAFTIMHNKTLEELARHVPGSAAELKKIHGIGKGRMKRYGEELLALIGEYRRERGMAPSTGPLEIDLEEEAAKTPKPNTKAVSLELYRAGKSIDEIAAERGLVTSTIEGHLAHFIGTGELDAREFFTEDDLEKFGRFFIDNPDILLTEARARFEEAYSFGQLKMAMAHARYQAEASSLDAEGV